MQSYRSAAGFTLLELAVAVVLIGILMVVAIDRLWPLIGTAERVSVQRAEGQMRSLLMTQAAKYLVNGDAARLAAMDGSNPFSFMLELPGNYLGELDGPDPASVPERSWYYDRRSRRVVYRIGSSRGFESALEGVPRIEYRVQVEFADRNGNHRYDPQSDDLGGIRLLSVPPYRWEDG